MTRPSDADIEADLLGCEAGRSLLARVAATAEPAPADLARWRKDHSAAVVAAALRLVAGRRKARAKFAAVDDLWLTPTGAEQATAEPVARHKAARFAASCVGVAVDLCCGVGGDTLALAGAGLRVLAVDLDEAMPRRVLWNATAYGVADHVLVVRARAEDFPIPAGALVHVDPDRRPGGSRREKSVGGYAPGPEFLRDLMTSAAGGAIKLGPASDFESLARADVEVELVGLHGECKEATVWFGALRGPSPRSATCLPAGATWRGTPGDRPASIREPESGGWLYDPDPCLVRSGLLDDFASHHGIARAAGGIAYLTSGHRLDSPFLTPFEVLEVLPMDRKQLRRAIRSGGYDAREVKVRGLDLAPESVRAWLAGTGGGPSVTVLLYGARRTPGRAIIGRRSTG